MFNWVIVLTSWISSFILGVFLATANLGLLPLALWYPMTIALVPAIWRADNKLERFRRVLAIHTILIAEEETRASTSHS